MTLSGLVLHHGFRWQARLLTTGCSSLLGVSSSSSDNVQLSHFSFSPICPSHILDIVVAPAAGGPHNWWPLGVLHPSVPCGVEAGRPLGGVSCVAMVAGGSPGVLCLPVLHGVTAGRPLGVYYLTYF